MTHLMQTYNRLPVSFVRGDGIWLWDDKGDKYFDALAGIAVCGLGHAHPAVSQAVCEQSKQLVHTSNLFRIPHQERLAEKLCAITAMDNVFFSNSGAEANEAALKIVRKYGNQKNIDTPTVIVTENSFHGRTLATLTATGNRQVQAGFEPLVKGFVRVPFNDVDAISHVAANNKKVVAVMVEPIQGEGGVNVPSDDYLNQVREICDQNNWFMILDEIQTGMCRTGHWFAHQHNGIVTDILTVAKSLGNGIPIGACIARGEASQQLQTGNHGSTFGGNPFASAEALAVIDTMQNTDMPAHVTATGQLLQKKLRAALSGIEAVVDVRGKGLMVGIELDRPCTELMTQALEQGLVINVTAQKVIRLLPPLIIDHEGVELLVGKLQTLIKAFAGS